MQEHDDHVTNAVGGHASGGRADTTGDPSTRNTRTVTVDAAVRKPSASGTDERDPTPRRRALLIAAVCVAAALVGAGLTAFAFIGRASMDDVSTAPETATVEHGDLTEVVKATGKIRLIDNRSIGTQLAGTVTSLPATGTVVGRGSELFRVDDGPVFAFIGSIPLWRDFEPGMQNGRDVAELQENLAALGHYDGSADGQFGSRTAAAIRTWQASVGLERTGRIELGRVVMLPGEGRVVGRSVEVGAPTSGTVLTIAQNRREITLDLPADRRDVTVVGAAVTIKLPDGTGIEGIVREFLAVTEKESNGSKKLMVPVTIDFADQAAAADMQDLSVSAEFERIAINDTLLVPVAALIADSGGQSIVQRPGKAGGIEDVPVTVTRVANGVAAIESEALSAGDTVVVGQ